MLKWRWPETGSVAAYLVVTGLLLRESMRLNESHLVYPVDDAYVHMAMAKNVALHHVWGIGRDAFSSSTSSPLWTLLLALTYAVFGVSTAAPMVFNAVAGVLILATIAALMRARSASPWLTFAVLLAVIVVTPLPTLTLTGMEHTMHALMTLWFVFSVAALLASTSAATTGSVMIAGVLGALVTGFRYEGIFTVGIAVLLFWARRRWRAGAIVALAGAAPIGIYGFWSVLHGWHFFPNSVLLKGQAPSLDWRAMLAFVAGSPALRSLMANPHLLLLVVAALTLLVVLAGAVVRNEDVFVLTLLAGTALLHAQLARTGWFYRYEAYLLVLGAASFGVIAADRLPPWRTWSGAAIAAAVVLLMIAGFPFASRGLNGFRNVPKAASNIYQQQYQMGLFLNRFYQGRSVALNDIGAVDYLADVKPLDVYGLASLEMLELKRTGRYESRAIAAAATREATDIAIVYPSWLAEYGGVPAAWEKVGEWGVRDNVVLGENAVSFYAVRSDERPRLIESLRLFAGDLPVSVIQAGAYTR